MEKHKIVNFGLFEDCRHVSSDLKLKFVQSKKMPMRSGNNARLIKNVEAAQVSSRLSQTLKLTVCGVFAGKKVCRRSESFFFLEKCA
jgi:hypothetical protein